MFSRISRNFVGLLLWLCIGAFFIALTVVVGLSNYLGCVASFQLLNIDRMPLWIDDLLGLLSHVFLDDATVAHLLALGMTCGIAAAWFLVTDRVFHLYSLLCERRDYIKKGDTESTRTALRKRPRTRIADNPS